MTVDGLPAVAVDTAEELTQVLVPGVYVRAPRAVLAACGWTDIENADPPEIVTKRRSQRGRPLGSCRALKRRTGEGLQQLLTARPILKQCITTLG